MILPGEDRLLLSGYVAAQRPSDPSAPDHGCAAHTDHGDAIPHKLYAWTYLPAAWQFRLYGEVIDQRSTWVCANAWQHLRALCGTLPISPGPMSDPREVRLSPLRVPEFGVTAREQRLLGRAIQEWNTATERLELLRRTGPRAVDPDTARCRECGGGYTQVFNTFVHHCSARDRSGVAAEGNGDDSQGA